MRNKEKVGHVPSYYLHEGTEKIHKNFQSTYSYVPNKRLNAESHTRVLSTHP